jgi:hypothetical protein
MSSFVVVPSEPAKHRGEQSERIAAKWGGRVYALNTGESDAEVAGETPTVP